MWNTEHGGGGYCVVTMAFKATGTKTSHPEEGWGVTWTQLGPDSLSEMGYEAFNADCALTSLIYRCKKIHIHKYVYL